MTNVLSRRGVFAFVLGLFAVLAAGAETMAQSIRFAVHHPTNHRLYEVIEGAGTGGRFVESPRTIHGFLVHGYTDRAQRGEFLWVFVKGKGVAQFAGVRSANNVLFRQVFNIPLPEWVFVRVPLDPRVDNVHAFVKMPNSPEVARRLPIGTRPSR